MSPVGAQQGQERQAPRGPQTTTVAGWSGLNMVETRLSIADDELAFLENGMLLGKRVVSVPLYNGPAGASLNANSIVKESYGCALTYGDYTAPHPVVIVVFEDGSAYMRDYFLDGNPIDSLIAPAGTFAASPGGTAIKIWQDAPILFLDAKAGYCTWNGTTFATVDSTKLGDAMAVFESHVWLKLAARTLTYTAPNSYSNFAASDGGGSFRITDDAFQGSITTIFSTVEQLWLLGSQAIDALGNVATSGGVTSFAVTNALTSLGTVFPDSVTGYFRALTFATGYSIHSLLGVTPQKLSAKIDRLFAQLDNLITFGPRVGVQTLNGVTVLCFLFQFTDGTTGATRSEVLCFQEGKWFLARTPDLNGYQVVDLVTLAVTPHGLSEVYGIDRAGRCYRVFARADDPPQGTLTVSSKLYDLGEPTKGHQPIRVGLDLVAPATTAIAPITLTVVSEGQSRTVVRQENFQALTDSPLGLRYALLRQGTEVVGQRIGWTLQVPCAYGVGLEAAHLQWSPTDDFDASDPAPDGVNFVNATGDIVRFTNGTPAIAADWLSSKVS